MEVWVVDNASQDGSIEAVGQLFPQVNLIRNTVNKGFAGGCNAALLVASSPYVLILNTDIIFKPGVVSYLLDFLEKRPEVGLVGGQLLHAAGSKQNSFDNFPNLLTELTNKSLLRYLFPSKYPSKYQAYDEPLAVESVIGACMLVRSKAIKQVGPLDEDYFFFLEETDWCFRLRRAGWKVYHLPAAQIVHLQGQSAQIQLAKARVEYYRSRYLFFRKHRGWHRLTLLVIMLSLRLILSTLFTSLLNLLTLFRSPYYREKAAIYWYVLFWHLRLCPASMGLRPTDIKGVPPGFSPTPIQLAGTKWFIRQDLLPAFTKETYEALNALLAGKSGLTVQDRRIRRIVQGELPTRNDPMSIYLKIYKLPGWSDQFKYLFRPSKAQREAGTALRLKEKGIPTINPLAIGERYKGRILQENYLITEEIKDAFSLDNLSLREGRKIGFRREMTLTNQLAQLVKKVHQQGVYHTDFHAGNFLIKGNGIEGPYQLSLMDLHQVKIKGKDLGLNKRINNLVQLNLFFSQRLRASARFRFFKEYCREITRIENNIARYARLIEARSRKASLRLYSRREKRCLRSNNDFMVFNNGPYRGYLRRAAAMEKELPALIDNLENLTVVKETKKSTLFHTTLPTGSSPENIYIKRYRYPGLPGFIKGCIRRHSRAIRAWKMAHAVLVRNFNTALPLAAIEARYLGSRQEGFYISKEVPAALGIDWFVLGEFGPDNPGSPGDKLRRKRLFITRLARLVRHWHSLNLYQRDLKASNILVQGDSEDQWKFYFIDLEGVRVLRRLRDKHRISNLSQLNTSFMRLKFIGRTDRMRFLKAYLGRGKQKNNPRVKQYWHQIWQITTQRLDHRDS